MSIVHYGSKSTGYEHPTGIVDRIMQRKGNLVNEAVVGSEVWLHHDDHLKATSRTDVKYLILFS